MPQGRFKKEMNNTFGAVASLEALCHTSPEWDLKSCLRVEPTQCPTASLTLSSVRVLEFRCQGLRSRSRL